MPSLEVHELREINAKNDRREQDVLSLFFFFCIPRRAIARVQRLLRAFEPADPKFVRSTLPFEIFPDTEQTHSVHTLRAARDFRVSRIFTLPDSSRCQFRHFISLPPHVSGDPPIHFFFSWCVLLLVFLHDCCNVNFARCRLLIQFPRNGIPLLIANRNKCAPRE